MKSYSVWVALLFAAYSMHAQSVPDLRFGDHDLGETAEIFFSTAKMADSKSLAKDYCKSLLDDQKTKEKAESARDSMNQRGIFVLQKKDFSLLDVSNCQKVRAALQGENSMVGARLASELGKGTAFFAAGELAALTLFPDSSYSEVVADMDRRFGSQGQKRQGAPAGWPMVKEEVLWEKDGVAASAFKDPSSDHAIVFIGYLRPPYDSFLRGKPASEPKVRSAAATVPPSSNVPTQRVQVPSGVMTGLLLHRVQPTYPEAARQNRVEGTVTLQAFVGKDGQIENLTPISGPDELVPAAMSAVQQWQYKPYIKSGEPVEVETNITVNFMFSH